MKTKTHIFGPELSLDMIERIKSYSKKGIKIGEVVAFAIMFAFASPEFLKLLEKISNARAWNKKKKAAEYQKRYHTNVKKPKRQAEKKNIPQEEPEPLGIPEELLTGPGGFGELMKSLKEEL